MEKRYQVFVSSTFQDLQEERQEVIQALLELDCIPAGMELFPAANDDQWTLIKKVIDDCDYYVVIVAGRYGSLGPEGISYTEMEYRYALDSGKPIIGFLHKDPGAIPANKCDDDPIKKHNLESFRNLVQQKMCRFWESPADLGSQMSRSLIKLIKSNPAIGWVRADNVPDKSSAEEILELRNKIQSLESALNAASTIPPDASAELAQGTDTVDLKFTFQASKYAWGGGVSIERTMRTTWNDIFSVISPLMIHETTDESLKQSLDKYLEDSLKSNLSKELTEQELKPVQFKLLDDDFQTIKVQFRALGLITKSIKDRSVKDTSTYWTLTSRGDDLMTTLRAVRKTSTVIQSSS